MAEFNPGAFGLAALMLSAQTAEALKAKGILTNDEVVAILNSSLNELRSSNTPSSIEAGALLLHFYNAVPDVSLLTPSAPEH